jgi:uncharacterized membrane protein
MAGGQIEANGPLDYLIIAAKVIILSEHLKFLTAANSKRSFFKPMQILFAVSPLLVLGYILLSAFESEEAELSKRRKKADFNLEGHAE